MIPSLWQCPSARPNNGTQSQSKSNTLSTRQQDNKTHNTHTHTNNLRMAATPGAKSSPRSGGDNNPRFAGPRKNMDAMLIHHRRTSKRCCQAFQLDQSPNRPSTGKPAVASASVLCGSPSLPSGRRVRRGGGPNVCLNSHRLRNQVRSGGAILISAAWAPLARTPGRAGQERLRTRNDTPRAQLQPPDPRCKAWPDATKRASAAQPLCAPKLQGAQGSPRKGAAAATPRPQREQACSHRLSPPMATAPPPEARRGPPGAAPQGQQ